MVENSEMFKQNEFLKACEAMGISKNLKDNG